MVELSEDLDSFFEDESVLSAVAAVENQHLKQRFSNNETGAQEYAGKRKGQSDERINSQSYPSYSGGFSNIDGFSEGKRRRTFDDREYSRPANFRQEEIGFTVDSKPEGEYMAALRGSNSETWLKASQGRGLLGNSSRGGASGYAGNAPGIAGGRGGASDACYKCGLEGHWARDCPKPTGASSISAQSGALPGLSDVPEKNCPCGAGSCIVLTASTERNLGRRFYKCPLKRDEGQCTFFEWCDGGDGGGGQSFSTDRGPTVDFPQIDCRCGGGPCVTLTAKTERNSGRPFYKCPLPKDQSCGFFQWCDEAGKDSSKPSTAMTVMNTSLSSSASPADGSCYKCGLGGHWAKDCTKLSPAGSGNSNNYIPGTKKDYGSLGSGQSPVGGSCFKCGQGGHWIRDCPNEGGGGGSGHGGGQAYNSTRTPEVKKTLSCYKCGNLGHWSSSCPNS